MRAVLRDARRRMRRTRLRLWAWRADLRLRRRGSRLVLELEGDVRWAALPALQITPQGLTSSVRGARPEVVLRLGDGVDLGRGLVIEVRPEGRNLLEVGAHCVFLAYGRVTLFDGSVRIGRDVQVRAFTMLKSSGELTIGDRAIISHQTIVHCARRIDVGSGVGLAERVSVVDSDHGVDGRDVHPMDQPVRYAPVTIGRNTFAGANAVILRGATIGPATLVGAGAVVLAGDYPGGWLLAGSPAKPVRPLPGSSAAAPQPAS